MNEEAVNSGEARCTPPPDNKKTNTNQQTIESIYLLWRTTGDPVWRERGWQLFQSMERWCRAE